MTKTVITDEYMKQMLATVKGYTVVILEKGPNFADAGAQQIIWEHARRNFSLRADGLLSIVCPIRDEGDMAGIGIFNADPDRTKDIMADDPAIKAGVLIYEVYPTYSFPNDSLPE